MAPGWLIDSVVGSEPGATGFEFLCGLYISSVCTCAVTQTVQIREIIMTTEGITDSRRIKNIKERKKNDQYDKVDM